MKRIYISAIILAIVAMGEGCVKLRINNTPVKSKQVQSAFKYKT